MADDTPTTGEIRADYVRDHTRSFDAYQVGRSLTSEQEHFEALFDRWLAEHDREIAERAWRDGYFTGKRDYARSITGGVSISTPNPHGAIPADVPPGEGR